MEAVRTPPASPFLSSRPRWALTLTLLSLAVLACGGGATDDGSSVPKLTSTSPSDTDTEVAVNAKLAAVFDRAMSPLTATTFTLKQGSTVVNGAVTTGPDGTTATFAPASALATNTSYTATITSAASSSAGVSFGADRSWSFTTGASADTTSPEVTGTAPSNGDTGVAINTKVTANFSEAMDPLSFTAATFTLAQGTAQVAGTVSYGPGTNATFTPSSALAANTLYTATVTTGAKDLAGNLLASVVTWTFTTGSTTARGPAVVGLGKAGNFAILAKTAISSVPTSTVTGDIGLGPAAASYITGFSLVADSTNVFSTSPQIVGKAYAADYAVPTPSNLTTAVANMQSAYTDAAGRPTPDFLELGTGNIGGKTLAPGLYKWTSTVTVPSDVTLSGGANDVWIFQTTGDLNVSASMKVILSGGAQAKNVFWQVAGKATFGAGSHFEGVLLCKTAVTLQTGASMNGRVLSQTQVALQKATLTQP
jgi:hypothetical protein